MTTLKLSDHIGNNQRAIFHRYANGVMYYETDCTGFYFAVPIADLGTALVGSNEPASMFMKWIKRQMEKNTQAMFEQSNTAQCQSCDSMAATFGPDPYQSDVNNDPTPVWLCDQCRESKAGDI